MISQLSALKDTDVKELQYLNAYSPIVITEGGIIMEARLLQDWKAEFPILVTASPIINVVKALHP